MIADRKGVLRTGERLVELDSSDMFFGVHVELVTQRACLREQLLKARDFAVRSAGRRLRNLSQGVMSKIGLTPAGAAGVAV
jgi:hypothetical protein